MFYSTCPRLVPQHKQCLLESDRHVWEKRAICPMCKSKKFAHIPMGMQNGLNIDRMARYKGNVSTVNNSCRRTPLTMPQYGPEGHFRVGWRREVSSLPRWAKCCNPINLSGWNIPVIIRIEGGGGGICLGNNGAYFYSKCGRIKIL